MDSIDRLRITPVFCTAIAAAAGYYILFKLAFAVIVSVLLLAVTALCFFRVISSFNFGIKFLNSGSERGLQITFVRAAAFTAGLALGLCAADAGKNEVNLGMDSGKVTAVEGALLEDPRVIASGSAMASLSLKKCSGAGGLRVSGSGEITVFFPRESAEKLKQYGRGAVIFAEGTLRSSPQGWSFSARSLHITKKAPLLERTRTGIRLNLSDRFNGGDWSALSLALLLGIRDNLDSGFTAQYRDAGLSYILALSGMHLAIIAALIAFFLKKTLGLKASAVTGSIFIIFYCLLVGPMPSLNRSAFMYIIGVITILGFFPKRSISVLSISFIIQIIVSPASGNSLSFILSYIALLGILITSRSLSFLLAGVIPDFILQPLSLSCGAFLATAGICGFTFGVIAPIGIIAGLFIVPLTAAFMAGSLLWLLLDIFSVSGVLSPALSIVYRVMESIASAAGHVPGIHANPVLVLVISLSISILLVFLEFRRRNALYQLQPFN